MALAGMTQEETYMHNREHCKRIADEIDDYAAGRCYRCPECGETLTIPDDVGDKYHRASYPLSSTAVEALDDWAQEMWEC